MNTFTISRNRILISTGLLLLAMSASAQLPATDSLAIDFERRDSVFFERSFNRCDFAYLDSAIHPDLIFYHDQGGMQNRQQFFEAVKNNICGAGEYKPIRKADRSSLRLFPLYDNGRLYGAIQMGVHYFYLRKAGEPDRATSKALFSHVWVLDKGRWLLREVLSYDHQPLGQ